ncbi:hypothetical protein [Dactylosporangium sp. NPDC048998]|uniref:hypothetical protein n=1 Tax=Dactylosporangium sp. NPDC048998 TaxID=3363976 RepID=UPI0037200282
MVKSRLLLVLALVAGAVTGMLGGGASSRASELDGAGLHCAAMKLRHGLYTEGCAAVGSVQDYTYIVGEGEASAYRVVNKHRVPAREVLVRIAISEIYVNGYLGDSRGCACSPAPYVQNSTRFAEPRSRLSGNTAQAVVMYEVWSARETPWVLLDTYTVMSNVVVIPDIGA